MKEFKVAQVIAIRSYNGEGLAMKKGEIFYVAAKTNKDWWNVRRLASKESGYVPTPYIKEIEPKVFKKPITEKVVVKETVKVKRKKLKKVLIERSSKEKLPDKRAKRTSSIIRKKNNQHGRKPRFTQHFDRENVTTRHLAIVVAYAKLKAATKVRDRTTYVFISCNFRAVKSRDGKVYLEWSFPLSQLGCDCYAFLGSHA